MGEWFIHPVLLVTCICVGQPIKLFFEAFGEISGTGEPHFKGHVSDIAEIGFQQLSGPCEPIRANQTVGGFAG